MTKPKDKKLLPYQKKWLEQKGPLKLRKERRLDQGIDMAKVVKLLAKMDKASAKAARRLQELRKACGL